MSASDLSVSDFTLDPPDPERDHRAALTVCANARDTADARMLLCALGLEVRR